MLILSLGFMNFYVFILLIGGAFLLLRQKSLLIDVIVVHLTLTVTDGIDVSMVSKLQIIIGQITKFQNQFFLMRCESHKKRKLSKMLKTVLFRTRRSYSENLLFFSFILLLFLIMVLRSAFSQCQS